MVCVMGAVDFASADIIRGIDIDFVTIGNAGNAADTGGTVGCGAVSYGYRIGKYEVTNAQWNAFTTAAGAPVGNDGGYSYPAQFTGAQQPPNNVSWYETLQFCNYLTSGDKSKGAYQFSGNNINPGDFLGINRSAAKATYGTIYFLPTEDEWYKAAYYTGSSYSLYANGTDTAPIAGVQSNYSSDIGTPWNVGTGTMEQNGTFDMMGNVWEWNETLLYGSLRGVRGGSANFGIFPLASSSQGSMGPYYEVYDIGFRVASVPEPPELAAIDIDPDTLNLSSKDKWVTCYIELPDGYDVMDIDGSTVMLEGIPAYIGAEGWARAGANSGNIMDHDGDGILERMVKFDRSAVQDYLISLGLSGYVGLTVTGDLIDGPSFEGIDVIRVIE